MDPGALLADQESSETSASADQGKVIESDGKTENTQHLLVTDDLIGQGDDLD